MTTQDRLNASLGAHYRSSVLGEALNAHEIFRSHVAADDNLLGAARTERDRLAALDAHCGGKLDKRDFASAKSLEFLKIAVGIANGG